MKEVRNERNKARSPTSTQIDRQTLELSSSIDQTTCGVKWIKEKRHRPEPHRLLLSASARTASCRSDQTDRIR